MTKSPFTGQSTKSQSCAASVDYKGRRGQCKREGKYPDNDCIRWWCGLHNPQKAKEDSPAVEVVATSAVASVKPKAVSDDRKIKSVSRQLAYADSGESLSKSIDMTGALMSSARTTDAVAVDAMRATQIVLAEIANTNTVGWGDDTPIENYKIIMAHMSDQAREAAERLGDVIRQLDT